MKKYTVSCNGKRYAWGIRTRYRDIDGTEYDGLLGVWWFDRFYELPPFAAVTSALFPTRKAARQAMEDYQVKQRFPRSRVVKVEFE